MDGTSLLSMIPDPCFMVLLVLIKTSINERTGRAIKGLWMSLSQADYYFLN